MFAMEKIKVLSIFGTRPEATKMVSPVKALDAHDKIESLVCVTAQHRELLDDVINPLGVVPDYDLNLMQSGQSLSQITSRALTGLENVIKEAKPDWVLVHGDTATTMAGSLAAFYNQVKVAHVEAGLRTYDKYQPFPEEINRKITTAIADLHIAPTELAREQLLKENVPEENIVVTGNTAIDLMAYTIKDNYEFENVTVGALDFSKRIILMTAHRRESWGEPLENICRAARRIADEFEDVQVVYAIHPNPVVKDCANKFLSGHDRVLLVDALSVFDLQNLMKRSYLVYSDSGGLQEEAPALDKPMVVLRETTERPEGTSSGALVLAGTNEDNIVKVTSEILTNETKYKQMAEAPNPFGDGKASGRIVEAILARGK